MKTDRQSMILEIIEKEDVDIKEIHTGEGMG